MNEIIAASRYSRYHGALQKKQETARCAWSILAGNVPTFSTPVTVHFKWIEPSNKRDVDNIAGGGTKFILDALVMLHRIPNDSREWVKGLSHEFPPPESKQPRVEVTITEV